MTKINLNLNLDNQLTEALRDFEKTVQRRVYRRALAQIITPAERELTRVLKTPPSKPDYPIKWASERQRRYVMRKLRKDNNLPYKRTGELVKRWYIEILLVNGDITINAVNDADMASYVYGPKQQPFLNKWPDAEDAVLDAALNIEDDLEQLWYDTVSDLLD